MVRTMRRVAPAVVITAAAMMVVALSACSLFLAPEGDGGRTDDPGAEVFVVHSLAETLSSVALNDDGSFGAVEHDLLVLGAVPNDIVRAGDRLIATISGENALLVISEDTVEEYDRISFGSGRNPMKSAVSGDLYPGTVLVATTHLLTGSVSLTSLVDATYGDEIAEVPVGAAPQAVTFLPGVAAGDVRVVAANTAYSTARPVDRPFGAATLTEITRTTGGTPTVRTIDLEAEGFDSGSESGLNPTVIIPLPAYGEVIVVGSGVNYGSDGSGADDGVVLILDTEHLDIVQRLEVGGSPGAAVVATGADGYPVCYLAGTNGIVRIHRTATEWNDSVHVEYDTTGTQPLIADIGIDNDNLYAADFAGNRLLRFSIGADDSLSLSQTVDLSQGPIAILVDRE